MGQRENILWDELPFWSAPFGIALLDRIRFRHGMRILDIGTGTGFPLTELAMRSGKESRVTGLDPDPEAVAHAKRKLFAMGIRNAEVVIGVAEKLPFDDQYFDLITSNNGLNNVAQLPYALEECARVLRPGGQLVETFNLDGTMAVFYGALEEVLLDLGLAGTVDRMHDHIHRKRPSLKEMVSLMEKQGLQIHHVLEESFAYRFINAEALFDHFLIRTAFMGPWLEIVPEERQTTVFQGVRERLDRLAETQGHIELRIPFAIIDSIRG